MDQENFINSSRDTINRSPEMNPHFNLNENNESKKKEIAKDYASEGFKPFVELFHKYRNELEPYFDSAKRAMSAGAKELRSSENAETATQDRVLANKIDEANNWLQDFSSRVRNQSSTEVMETIEQECEKHPGMSFGLSYIAGLAAGRIMRHLKRPNKTIQRLQFS